MKKKALCILMASMMAFSMTACGGETNTENKVTETPVATETPSAETTPEAKPDENAANVEIDLKEMFSDIQAKADLNSMNLSDINEAVSLYGIEKEALADAAVLVPLMNVNASEFAVFKANSEADVEKVMAGVNKRIADLTEVWSTYLPDQYELVENHTVITKGNYVLMMIGEADIKAYVQNVFERKFDPSIEEVVLLRKFQSIDCAEVVALTENGMTIKLVEGDKTYTFEGTYSADIYFEEDKSTYQVGDLVTVNFIDPVTESESMKPEVSYVSLYKISMATGAKVTAVTDGGMTLDWTAKDGTAYTFNCTFDEYFDLTMLEKAIEVGDTVDAYFSEGVVPTSTTLEVVVGYCSFAE